MATSKKTKTFIEIDTTHMNEAQVRQLKTLNSLLSHVLSTDEEGDFFDGSAEAMRICAALIKQANFPSLLTHSGDIPYADQALEYSVDLLQEHMGSPKIVSYDN